ncbi:hypothetical protein D0T84_14430 [Dysgonomonas sp. 521]|uniref:hypothetical protein n=1 Tax=Dysgonomonas sp. 521 TaxID=2302932 RepID=UPI0013D826C2|nr:hypothetical protein [Dysgonomonas sp. 521]NDV96099.1 hypothetical protein [Dysgonomonas sp. 521]
MGKVLTEQETAALLNRISNKKRYKQVMDFLDDSESFYPFSISEMKLIIKKAVKDAQEGKGKTVEQMRIKYPK